MNDLLTMAHPVSLKTHPEINEAAIQEFIFEHPEVLGFGDISALRREKIQPTGGRLDILLGDDETRYEVEIMLGATDPSHIIRTIEYWDSEKKRYPRYNHVAVIVAEDITARFLNVISLFNGVIPLVAIQMVATQNGDKIALNFIKILDHTEIGDEEENEIEPTDRKYWENRSNVLEFMDDIYKNTVPDTYELKYTKFYIGLSRNGVASNFIYFKPKKKFMYLLIRLPETPENSTALDASKLDYDYAGRERAYRIRITDNKEIQNNINLINEFVNNALGRRNNVEE